MLFMKPWLFLPASWTHFLSPWALKVYSRIAQVETCRWRPFCWQGLNFQNPLGIAGGVDKNALHIKDWQNLGAGFLEVGTVTPLPQKANPSKILDRSLKYRSLWNNMGFPNKGLGFIKKQLQAEKCKIPLFINIGKNRSTPLPQAIEDYKKSIEALCGLASAFVINISSPNTSDLRKLFDPKTFCDFLKSLKKFTESFNKVPPLILKISPDERDFLRIIEQSLKANIDGWCVCNSTKERVVPGLFPKRGGVSGKLLSGKSLSLLRKLKKYLSENKVEDKLIISCGGVLTAQDVLERLNEGAHLVQVYSALVFEGPGFFRSALKELSS